MGARLLVIGSTNVDLFTTVPRHPSPGETLLGTGGQRAAGGKGANQALAAALQGADVTFVGAVGDDADAELALAGMRAAGVDLDAVLTVPDAPTGLAIITVSEAGENTIVVIAGANAHVGIEAATTAIAGMDEGDVLLMQGEVPRETIEAAARAARDAGRGVILNVAPWMALDHDVLTSADPLVLNEHEAHLAVEELGLTPASDSPEAVAEAIAGAGTPSVVVTLGAEGAVLVRDGDTHQVASPRVSAVDTTGAGDAFTGALAARLLEGQDLATAVTHAVRVGAYSVQHSGAQSSYPGIGDELP
ncbi:ribokinase [Ornithinimicrobium sp. F0845]|uniref:ribokinase n=1 Tax=Ornithinimicrobium sp. F0845 TaxID=2926412 RepID=UPI001FF63A72|nr:ribokinase [Ornithinimicrobium sp. F0845]MCK0114024.1 ribokinase [Ornithinimicrobium sp. F0845]